jgi:hypothetical protein
LPDIFVPVYSVVLDSTISAIIMQCVYGIQVRESDDIYIETAEEAMDSLAQVGLFTSCMLFFHFVYDSTARQEFRGHSLWIYSQYVRVGLSFMSSCSDVFLVRYVPPWVPGAGFQRKAARWRSVLAALVDRPFKVVKQELVCSFVSPGLTPSTGSLCIPKSKGTAVPSVAATLLQQLPDGDHRAEHEIIAKNYAGVAYTGQCF